MKDANEQDDLISSLDGREMHHLMHSLAHEMLNHSMLCGLAAQDYKRLRQATAFISLSSIGSRGLTA